MVQLAHQPMHMHTHIITFTAMTDIDSPDNVGSAPLIPPCTNEMYLLEKGELPVLNAFQLQMTRSTRLLHFRGTHCRERYSDTESMSAWIEDAKTDLEVDRDMEFPEDTVSETRWDINWLSPTHPTTNSRYVPCPKF